jgi:hypothetical protein
MAPEVKLARITEPADEGDVMREQMDYLIDHVALNAKCGCCECRRYFRARAALLEIFDSPHRRPRLMKAA